MGRDEHSGEVLARGGDPEAHSILQRTGFVPVVRLHETYHRLPVALDAAEERRLAIRAVARLRAVRYHVEADEAFDTETRQPHYLPLGSQVAHLAEQIHEATTSDEVSDVLSELTASHDGVLIALGEVLTAAAAFYSHLGQAPDPHTAKRLQYLVEHRSASSGPTSPTCATTSPTGTRTIPSAASAPPRSDRTNAKHPPSAPARLLHRAWPPALSHRRPHLPPAARPRH
ncbi:hypothetical protein AB0K64_30410 [Streptomyces sp. NPDC053741]|uniref:hypothetical protein n=1 Tax=Streptomyces TaxID=1883 RepID=UPI00343A2BD6